ncbi:MAG: tetratricopeptide (TPR) repeat protein [Myxococcota bacterium]|jgi:tetratricopeptide (TPR) repeat protein
MIMMRAIGTILALVLLALPTGSAQAQETPEALFAEGNDHYIHGRYSAAVETYGALSNAFEVEDPALYHNLGNAYFKSGAYGLSILYYQRALRMKPDATLVDALSANLDAARRTLQTRYRAGGDRSQFVYAEPGGLLYRATHALDSTTLALLFAVFWIGLMACLIGRRLRPALLLVRRITIPVGILALLLGLMLWGQQYTDASYRIGVVIEDGAKIREGKHVEARGDDIPEGLELRLLKTDQGWTLVERASGSQGWLESAAIKQI